MLAKAILTDNAAVLLHVRELVDVSLIRGHLLGEYGIG
jgi:hypothetical protein